MDFAKDREELARLEQEEAKAKADYAALGEEIKGLRRELKIAKEEKATVEGALNARLKEFLKVAIKDHKRDRGALREATKKAAEQARAEFADAIKAADLKVKEVGDELEKKLHRYNHFFVSYKPEMLKEGVALRVIHLKQFFDMGGNYKTKAVHCSVRDLEDAAQVGVQARLKTQGLVLFQFPCFYACSLAALDPLVHISRLVLVREHKEAFRLVNALSAYAPQDGVFAYALCSCFPVAHSVAAATVQKAVKARACAVAETALLEKYGRYAAHGQIAQYACDCGATTYDNHCCLF